MVDTAAAPTQEDEGRIAIVHAIAAQHQTIATQLATLEDLTNMLRCYDRVARHKGRAPQREDDRLENTPRVDDSSSFDDVDEELSSIEARLTTHPASPEAALLEAPTPLARVSPSMKRHCRHGKQKAHCRECGGSIFCPHGKRKNLCTVCGGSSMCFHGRRARECSSIECRQSSICKHRVVRKNCTHCRDK